MFIVRKLPQVIVFHVYLFSYVYIPSGNLRHSLMPFTQCNYLPNVHEPQCQILWTGYSILGCFDVPDSIPYGFNTAPRVFTKSPYMV